MSELDRALRAYAVQSAPQDRRRQPDVHLKGVVAARAPDGSTMDIQFPDAVAKTPGGTDAAQNTIAKGVRVLEGSGAQVGDTVWLVRIGGGDLLVLGRLVPIPRPDVFVPPDPSPDPTWRFLSAPHFGFGGPDRVRYLPDGRTLLYRMLPGDPTRSLDIIDVTDVDHMAVLNQSSSPDWALAAGASSAGGRGWSVMPPFYPDDDFLPLHVWGGPVVGGGGNPAYQGIAVVDLGPAASPHLPPVYGDINSATYGGISGGSSTGPVQKATQWWWHLQYGFVWFEHLLYGILNGTTFGTPSGDLNGWPGSGEFLTPWHLIQSMALHPDPGSEKVYSFGSAEVLVFDGFPPAFPLVVAETWSTVNPGSGPPALATLRGTSAPVLVGIAQHSNSAWGGGASQDGIDVWYADLTDPLNPVLDAWPNICSTGPNNDIAQSVNDPLGGVVSMSYDASGRCFVVTRDSVTGTSLTLWWLDLVHRTVLKSVPLPSWAGSGQTVTGCFVTKDYKNLGVVTSQGVWALPLY